MDKTEFDVGRVVLSRAGRDKGAHFLVLESSGEYCLIADGKTRKLARPKKKKQKHLKACPEKLEAIAEKLRSGAKVFDSEIFSGLKKYNAPAAVKAPEKAEPEKQAAKRQRKAGKKDEKPPETGK
jgi:ribosomal protein L14E/L6E/L27E